eukprot:TRINITY_DN3120_c0_g1_i3.p1 TRINITY_DN3120_c0_g1~~TRINITY_DN3120_c0_g1_i3.p1  ORF type:complete len:210 (+),score=44.53 TRINITY_DN3120_c0_g1_i3:384-1013(+)
MDLFIIQSSKKSFDLVLKKWILSRKFDENSTERWNGFDRRYYQWISLFFIILVFQWNLMNFGKTEIPQKFQWLVRKFHLEQKWDMFAPDPPSQYWWYTIHGTLQNNSEIGIFEELFSRNLREFSWEKPDPMAFKSIRWYKYFDKGFNRHENKLEIRRFFVDWLRRNFEYDGHILSRLEIYFVQENLHSNGNRDVYPPLLIHSYPEDHSG